MALSVRRAVAADLEIVADLFDQYRQFYHQPSDLELARRFIGERLEREESVLFLAETGGNAVGFIQLYPAFSSVSARRIWILNDLFVAPAGRRRGVGRRLMEAVAVWAGDDGAARLVLETMPDNRPAQALYEELGWRRGETWHYELALD